MNERPFDNPYQDATMVKNVIFDHIMPTLSSNGWKVLCAVIRQCWGGFDPISSSGNAEASLLPHGLLMQRTGIQEQDTIDRAITECLDAGYLARHQVGKDPQSGAALLAYALNAEFQIVEEAEVVAFPSAESEEAFQTLLSFAQEMGTEPDAALAREAVIRNDASAVMAWIETGREMTHLETPVRFETVVQRLLDRVPPLLMGALALDLPDDVMQDDDGLAPPETELPSAQELWQGTLEVIRGQVKKSSFRWFEPTHAVDFSGSTLTVAVPNKRTREWLEEGQLASLVQQTVESVAGGPVELVFVVGG